MTPGKIIVALIIAVVLIIGVVQTIHAHEQSDHRSQELAVYDKCLYESYPGGADCQTVIHDCTNGDSYACQLASQLGCLAQTGAGCDNTGGS